MLLANPPNTDDVWQMPDDLEEHRAVRAALDIFGRDTGEAKIRDLAAHLGLSQRHFIRVFSNQVGVTLKLFGRVSEIAASCLDLHMSFGLGGSLTRSDLRTG